MDIDTVKSDELGIFDRLLEVTGADIFIEKSIPLWVERIKNKIFWNPQIYQRWR